MSVSNSFMPSPAELPPEQRGTPTQPEQVPVASLREGIWQLSDRIDQLSGAVQQQNEQINQGFQRLEQLLRPPIATQHENPSDKEDNLKHDLTTAARITQAWLALSPTQKLRVWKMMKDTVPLSEAVDGHEYISVQDASLALDVTEERVKSLLYKGLLLATRDARKRWRISKESIDAYRARRSDSLLPKSPG